MGLYEAKDWTSGGGWVATHLLQLLIHYYEKPNHTGCLSGCWSQCSYQHQHQHQHQLSTLTTSHVEGGPNEEHQAARWRSRACGKSPSSRAGFPFHEPRRTGKVPGEKHWPDPVHNPGKPAGDSSVSGRRSRPAAHVLNMASWS